MVFCLHAPLQSKSCLQHHKNAGMTCKAEQSALHAAWQLDMPIKVTEDSSLPTSTRYVTETNGVPLSVTSILISSICNVVAAGFAFVVSTTLSAPINIYTQLS